MVRDEPPPRAIPDARERIRAAHRAQGRRIAVLDDDPTGSQAVHDVEVVFTPVRGEYEPALATAGATAFVLTNSRSLAEDDAAALTRAVGHDLADLEREQARPVTVVSRSDSTLRGHVMAEVGALDAARREVLGAGYDGVLLVPAYLEAGRYTAGDTHWAVVDGEPVPVGRTEFARDASFGYTSSDLRAWVAERSGGRIAADDVASLSLTDIREGGPGRVAQVLGDLHDGRFVVVNATEYADLEVVVLGLVAAWHAGRTFLSRCGPSFVRALAGLEPQPPLTAERIWPDGHPGGHGLVVVGSHVGLTTRQVEVALARGDLAAVTLEVPAVLDPATRQDQVSAVTTRVRAALTDGDVLLATSRTVRTGGDRAASLAVARAVSQAVTEVVAHVVAAGSPGPRWVVAKGGITSHDVATRGLGIRRARVLGQLFPGVVSVFEPVTGPGDDLRGLRYVVFAGNVGTERTLAEVIDRLRPAGRPR